MKQLDTNLLGQIEGQGAYINLVVKSVESCTLSYLSFRTLSLLTVFILNFGQLLLMYKKL